MRLSSTSSAPDRFEELSAEWRQLREEYRVQETRRDVLIESRDRTEQKIGELRERSDYLKMIEGYLAQFADERQAQVYRQIETTVTEGLTAVFGEEIRLEISTKMHGARSETVFNVVTMIDGEELRTSIMDARGGGVAGIVGFLVQAVLVLLTPNMRPIIFLDESFRNVSEEYQAPLGEFIKELCQRTGLQVVLVTHQPTIAEYADTWYAFSQTSGKTKVRKIR